ncbi:MAG: 4Fe-4S dicluster domain-containing protein [Candidatus Binataceae bacterium]
MRYGFAIDQNRCIGCHACTVACKEEHNVPVGVFRTWVKYIEKGKFPDVSRHFAVLRCNHCDDAPCVEICPTSALFRRDDGIVDFDNARCIGCKSCMQACPYDALYIDPNTNTAAKCNYCAHRVEAGLEPACVIVCPTQAIISGDLDNPSSRIGRAISNQKVVVRKPHKGTQPKLFYIGVDGDLLNPTMLEPQADYLWSDKQPDEDRYGGENMRSKARSIPGPGREVYDVAHRQPWGKMAAAYLWTKSIGAGALIVAFIMMIILDQREAALFGIISPVIAILFTAVTSVILILDLKRPDRFYYLLTKPNFSSWLVWGCYILMLYGVLSLIWLAFGALGHGVSAILIEISALFGVFTACYSAFLFAQAKGRELWQSSVFMWHLLVQAIAAGAAALMIPAIGIAAPFHILNLLAWILMAALLIGAAMIVGELSLPAADENVERAAALIATGPMRWEFWGIVIVIGVAGPVALLALGLSGSAPPGVYLAAAILALAGLWSFENIWIDAGQAVPLS